MAAPPKYKGIWKMKLSYESREKRRAQILVITTASMYGGKRDLVL